MIIQSKSWTCGAAAVVNALQCIGIKTTEKQVLKYTGTTRKEGTDSPGIVAALRKLGAKGSFSYDTTDNTLGMNFIDQSMTTIIPIHDWNHWVVVVGRTAEGLYLVIDSGRTAKNKKVGGFHVITLQRLNEIWEHSKKGLYSGVVVKTSKGDLK